MARRGLEAGMALVTAGAVLAGAAACSGGRETQSPPAATSTAPAPRPLPSETLGALPACHMGIKWLSAHSIRLTLSKPANIPGSVMYMDTQWGNGTGSAENANAVADGTELPSAVPIVEDGQPVVAGPESYHDGTYTVSAELLILRAGQTGSMNCSQTIHVPHG
jgi:hypothetical protein